MLNRNIERGTPEKRDKYAHGHLTIFVVGILRN